MENPFAKENDLKKLRRIFDLFDVIKKISFETEECKQTSILLTQSIDEIIKPQLIETGNKIK